MLGAIRRVWPFLAKAHREHSIGAVPRALGSLVRVVVTMLYGFLLLCGLAGKAGSAVCAPVLILIGSASSPQPPLLIVRGQN